MKLLVPGLASAWEGQLLTASRPFHELSRWSVPFIEILLGVMLLLGTFARVAVVVVIGSMLVASYVHVVVQDPTLFPLQPSEPIIPVVVITLSAYLLWKGGGAWSSNIRATQGPSNSGSERTWPFLCS